MQTIKKAALVLVGIVLGCGGAAVAPMAVSVAQTPGKWACYDSNDFPDLEIAAAHAKKWTDALNAVASSAPSGSTITPGRENSENLSYFCVKN